MVQQRVRVCLSYPNPPKNHRMHKQRKRSTFNCKFHHAFPISIVWLVSRKGRLSFHYQESLAPVSLGVRGASLAHDHGLQHGKSQGRAPEHAYIGLPTPEAFFNIPALSVAICSVREVYHCIRVEISCKTAVASRR